MYFLVNQFFSAFLWFQFFGSTSSAIGPVLITMVRSARSSFSDSTTTRTFWYYLGLLPKALSIQATNQRTLFSRHLVLTSANSTLLIQMMSKAQSPSPRSHCTLFLGLGLLIGSSSPFRVHLFFITFVCLMSFLLAILYSL